ncbi:ABC transporter permease family protein [Alicyclobacillus vulcanalis]|uniref:Multiple sugar transport system permease protein/raffinose/stachyose/melibiose transport system permease protein n=1 Tax=Alicyclobacillus vulcanalis TaxID=252246 RepID=A0A1N7N2C2_9BACL|nr:carbohydrate ABC transporter permease [Alicyclobacillus vulcanalis]SIS92472.1 multiple sugar transport system permease protein/raffinose/stachyose/melibiose transport system permease protein [Alicyclobacillus vulcanalis]
MNYTVLTILLVMTYIPFLQVVANSVKSDAQLASHPLGVLLTFHYQNYVTAWDGMWGYLLNTVIVAGASVLIGVPFAAAAGYVFATSKLRLVKYAFYAFLALTMIPSTLTLIPLFVEVKTFGLYNTWLALMLPYAAGSNHCWCICSECSLKVCPLNCLRVPELMGAQTSGF